MDEDEEGEEWKNAAADSFLEALSEVRERMDHR